MGPIWSSRWIVQEIFLSQDAVVRCGKHAMPWSVFTLALRAIQTFVVDGCKLFDSPALQVVNARFIEERNSGQRQNLLYFMNWFGNIKCSDPRDRLFALYGLLSAQRDTSAYIHLGLNTVNYSQPWHKIYEQVALTGHRIILPARAWQFQSTLAVQDQKNSTIFQSLFIFGSLYQTDPSAPTWVPNWVADRKNTLHRQIHIEKLYEPGISALGLGRHPVASVKRIFCTRADQPFTARFQQFVVHLLSLETKQQTTMLQAFLAFFDFWQTPIWEPIFNFIYVTGGQLFCEALRRTVSTTAGLYSQRLRKILDGTAQVERSTEDETRVNMELQNTAVCVATDDSTNPEAQIYICFVPIGTSVGDIVACPTVINDFGHCDVVMSPFKLRPVNIDALHMVDEAIDSMRCLQAWREKEEELTAYRILGEAVMIVRDRKGMAIQELLVA